MDYYYLCKYILTKLWDNLSLSFPCHLSQQGRSILYATQQPVVLSCTSVKKEPEPRNRKYISNRSIASCWDSLNSTHVVLPVGPQMCLACTDGWPPECESNSGCLSMARSVLPHLENQPTHTFDCFRCLFTVLFCRYSSCSYPGCCCRCGCVSKLSYRTSEAMPSAHPCAQVPLLITLLPALGKVKLGT